MTRPISPSTRFLYFVLLWCVFSFKVLLGGIVEAGLRIDDLLLLIGFVILALRGDLVRVPRSSALRGYLTFLMISLFSSVWNGIAGRVGLVYSAIFVVRLLEYTAFYYLGYVLSECGVNVWRGLRIYFYFLCVVVLLQTANVLPTASQFSLSRASGNTNGPYELAAVAAFFLCYFGYRERKKLKAAGAFAILLMTASRITFLGTLAGFVIRFFSRTKSKARVVAIALLTIVLIGAGANWVSSRTIEGSESNALGNRLKSASSLVSVDYMGLYSSIPAYQTSDDYTTGMFLDSGSLAQGVEADTSGVLRVFRWASLVKSTVLHFDSIFIGLGPSFGSAAVDGNYIRVFIETGLLGLIAFLVFLSRLLKQTTRFGGAFREFIFILIVTGCFIDIFASYKTMLLLWLWNGMNEFDARQRVRVHRVPEVLKRTA
jgi:hypothetical protein